MEKNATLAVGIVETRYSRAANSQRRYNVCLLVVADDRAYLLACVSTVHARRAANATRKAYAAEQSTLLGGAKLVELPGVWGHCSGDALIYLPSGLLPLKRQR